ncbi:MAG TPA: hypothetical protein VGO11_15180 [Chthoniobacteraceae bacterium]|jgi:hypothetical protein|nr:hypothetical protein [Chthoniobacteraceae bacterium]
MKTYPVLPTLLLTALAAGSLWQSALAEEPSRRSLATPSMLFPFDVYAKHREAIGLSEDQVKELRRIAEGMGDAARKLEGERRERTEALQEAVAHRPIELDQAMQRFQGVLQVENEMKALQFRSGVAAQNLLSPEQAAKVQAIAAKTQGSRDGSNAGNEAGALREKLEQLKGELRKRGGGELSKDAVGTLERVEQAAQQGKLEEAKKQMEGLLAQLGRQGEARKGKEPATNAQPSAADIAQELGKVEKEVANTSDPEKRERLQQQLAKLHKMQEILAANSDPSRREKSTFKGDDDKGKQPDRPEKGPFKGDGEGKDKTAPKKDSENKDKAPLKGDGENKEKGKFDKNAENTKRPDPELRKRVEGALAEFQEAKAAGNREGMEKITKAIESLLRDSAREGGSSKDGERKKEGTKDGAQKDGDRKEGAVKDGERKKEGPKDGDLKEGAVKDGARKDAPQKDGERKEGEIKDGAAKDGARKEGGIKE